jgi:TonB-dependent SusC/RagA subfamily outer membrane receptor
VNQNGPDLFISLHCNETKEVKHTSGPSTEVGDGIEFYIPVKENAADYTGSRLLATHLNATLGKLNEKMLGIKSRRSTWILDNVKSPAVLIETGAIKMNGGPQKLKDAAYQKQIAESILQGINNYLSKPVQTQLNKAALGLDTIILKEKGKEGETKLSISLKNGPLNKALIIVDGKKATDNVLETLNPDQIQSIDVLKNESATALYGDEGKNGVVVITTKTYVSPGRTSWINLTNEKVTETGAVALMSFQTFVKDALGNTAKYRIVHIKDIIYQGSATGTKVWEETHKTTTMDDGIATIGVGGGKKTGSVSFTDLRQLDWANGPFFINIKVAVEPSVLPKSWVPEENYSDIGTSQIKNVPLSVYGNKGLENMKISEFNETVTRGIRGSISGGTFSGTLSAGTIPGIVHGGTINSGTFSGTISARTIQGIVQGGTFQGNDGTIIRYPDSAKWVKGYQVEPREVRVEGFPTGRRYVVGYPVNPATEAFKKRNPSIKTVNWTNNARKIIIDLFDGTEETYDLNNPGSRKRAENKYGKLPVAPPAIEIKDVKLEKVKDVKLDEVVEGGIYTGTQETPNFPGGLPAWAKYLERNLDKDIVKKNGGLPGRYTVTVSFIVDKTGSVSDVTAENDPGYGTREEALRLIRKGPKWKPAMQNGNPVIYRHRQPITFYVADPKSQIQNPDPVFAQVQIPAQFPGGSIAWTKYLERNLDKDIVKKNGGPPGTYTAIISFIVDKTGNKNNPLKGS